MKNNTYLKNIIYKISIVRIFKLAIAKDIMTKKIITIKENTSVRDTIKLILEKRISGIPVVDDNMLLVGIISEKDLLQLAFFGNIDDAKVADLMSKDVHTMQEDTDLLEIYEFFTQNNYKRVPILSNNKLVGIISRKDMLKHILDT